MDDQDAPPIIPTIYALLTDHCDEVVLFWTGDSYRQNYFGRVYHPRNFVDFSTLYVEIYLGFALKQNVSCFLHEIICI
jgi:hypothetical protein